MEDSGQVHVVGPDDDERARLVELLGDLEPRVHETPAAARQALGEERAVLVLTGAVAAEELLELGRTATDEDRPWILLRAREDDAGEVAFRPISTGYAVGPERLGDAGEEDDDEPPIFALPELLRIVARVRHDINNPLTAGLAELQLLLMDVEDPETREALETVQRQLQRIQELVEELARLRRPTRRLG